MLVIPDAERISTHALREEGDALAVVRALGVRPDFYPRPPRGGRPQGALVGPGEVEISTHALREEGDVKGHRATAMQHISTHALREEGDRHLDDRQGREMISTHALREEGDRCCPW